MIFTTVDQQGLDVHITLMLEVSLCFLMVPTSGEYLQSILLPLSVQQEQNAVGAFRHPSTASLGILDQLAQQRNISRLF